MQDKHQEYLYLDLLKEVIQNGVRRKNRTGTDTFAIFGKSLEFDLEHCFPLFTTKKMYWKGIVGELIWMLKGDTNIKFLVDNNIHIWDDDAYRVYLDAAKFNNFTPFTKKEFISQIKEFGALKSEYYHLGNLGSIYGKQWRNWAGADQIKSLIASLKEVPDSRRHVISSWNVSDLNEMGLPPCHYACNFSVVDGKLYCNPIQRSWDLFLGAAWNIAFYSLLTYVLSQWSGLEPGKLVYWAWDIHLYENHLSAAKEQIMREPREFPTLNVSKDLTLEDVESCIDVDEFMSKYIKLEGYNPHSSLKADLCT